MLWPVFVLLPLLFTTLTYVTAARRSSPRALVVAALVGAALECVIYTLVLGAWAWFHILAACLLSVLTPWLAALAFAWLVPLRRGERWWATAVPMVYVAALAVGVAVGDASGWVPQ